MSYPLQTVGKRMEKHLDTSEKICYNNENFMPYVKMDNISQQKGNTTTMRYLKVLFGRMAVVAAAIILQVLLFFVFLSVLNSYYNIIGVFGTIISIIVLISIVNRDMITEAKITWVIVVLLMPLLGTLLYLLFAGNQQSRKQKRFLSEITKQSLPYYQNDPQALTQLREEDSGYLGQATYIFRTTHQGAYGNTHTDFFDSGEHMWEDLLNELRNAQHFIFLEFFIIEAGEMWNAVLAILEEKIRKGVEVRLMYDDIGSIGKVPKDYYKTLQALGIDCIKFHPFRPVITAVHNNRNHRKIVVIDGTTGYVCGLNLADEYINRIHPFGEWKDTGVKLRGPGVDGLTLMFLQDFDSQKVKLSSYAPYLTRTTDTFAHSGVVVPYGDGPRPMYHEYVAENVYLNMISQAKHYLWITTPYLIIDNRLEGALCAAAQRGVDVRIVTPHIPDKKMVFHITRAHYPHLQAAGVKIYEFTPGFLHAKQFLCDDICAIVGTINLDYRSLVHHFECGVWMYRTPCIPDIKQDFLRLFARSQNMADFRQAWYTRWFCRLCATFFPLL